MEFFQIVVSNWKVHSLVVVFVKVFLILLMPSWMLSMTILEMFGTSVSIFQTVFIFVIDTNTTTLRVFYEFWWLKIKSSSFSYAYFWLLLFCVYCFHLHILVVSILGFVPLSSSFSSEWFSLHSSEETSLSSIYVSIGPFITCATCVELFLLKETEFQLSYF